MLHCRSEAGQGCTGLQAQAWRQFDRVVLNKIGGAQKRKNLFAKRRIATLCEGHAASDRSCCWAEQQQNCCSPSRSTNLCLRDAITLCNEMSVCHSTACELWQTNSRWPCYYNNGPAAVCTDLVPRPTLLEMPHRRAFHTMCCFWGLGDLLLLRTYPHTQADVNTKSQAQLSQLQPCPSLYFTGPAFGLTPAACSQQLHQTIPRP